MTIVSTFPANALDLQNIANASGAVALNCTKNAFSITQTGNITFSFSNVPIVTSVIVQIKRTGSFFDTWPASVSWQDNVQPAASIGPGLKDVYALVTFDSGTSWVAAPFVEGAPA